MQKSRGCACLSCLPACLPPSACVMLNTEPTTSPQVQLRAVGVDIPPEPEGGDSAALALTLDMLEMPAEELERRFRDVWGNNADEIRSGRPCAGRGGQNSTLWCFCHEASLWEADNTAG